MINVVIADDHPIVRAGLKQIISEEADIAVAGEASNGVELLNLVRHHEYDVILLDLTMPGMDGLDLLESGMGAEETVAALLEADQGSAHRQVGVVDASGGTATATGD